MTSTQMKLEVLVPFQVFARIEGVSRIVAETSEGSFGILPNRRDCIADLEPGILCYETMDGVESLVAIDEGILVKAGQNVLISVRQALAGSDLGQLRRTVEEEFLALEELERTARAYTTKMESHFLRRFARLQNE